MIKFRPFVEEIDGELIPWKQFKQAVYGNYFTDDDGFGEFVMWDEVDLEYKVSNITVDLHKDNKPEWATHVVWYNK